MDLSKIFSWKKPPKSEEVEIKESGSIYNGADYDSMASAFRMFTGSTIPGTMPMPSPWRLDYYALRERSWQAYQENELAASFLDRLRHFVINCGLKMQYEPSKLLESLGVEMLDEDKALVERDFNTYASSTCASRDGRRDLHMLADEAYLNTLTAGDLLVVLHIVKGEIKVQHIDGRNVVNPWDRGIMLTAARKGNMIVNGVEYDKVGREIAYYVRQDNFFPASLTGKLENRFKTERIPSYGKSGRLMAFRPSRDNQRIGGGRGKPILTPVLQKLEIMRRYELAELLAAEMNAKFVATIEHDEFSSNENPLQGLPNGGGRHTDGQAQELYAAGYSEDHGDKVAGKVTNVTDGNIVNMGRGQKLKSHDTKRPNVDGAKFLESGHVATAAAVGIPHEVARMLFTASYSASRAALEMFKIIMLFERKNFASQYYTVIAKERMRLRALQGKISMPKPYIQAIIARDESALVPYETFRFTGVVVPHVDPLKEVKAAIEKIKGGLSTWERETEALGTGDFEANAERLKKETETLDSAGLMDMVMGKTEEEDGSDEIKSEKTDDGKGENSAKEKTGKKDD